MCVVLKLTSQIHWQCIGEMSGCKPWDNDCLSKAWVSLGHDAACHVSQTSLKPLGWWRRTSWQACLELSLFRVSFSMPYEFHAVSHANLQNNEYKSAQRTEFMSQVSEFYEVKVNTAKIPGHPWIFFLDQFKLVCTKIHTMAALTELEQKILLLFPQWKLWCVAWGFWRTEMGKWKLPTRKEL